MTTLQKNERKLSEMCRCEEEAVARQQLIPDTTTGQLTGLLNMMGFDNRRLGNIALNMLLYVGELTANSLLDVDNNINTEIPQYRSFSDSGDIFSFIKVQLPTLNDSLFGNEVREELHHFVNYYCSWQ